MLVNMDKAWLRAPRSSPEYGEGVKKFIELAIANCGQDKTILCPCQKCGNMYWLGKKAVHEHLICEGFMTGYNTWIFHGEIPGIDQPSINSDDDPMEMEEADTDAEYDHYANTGEMSQMLMDGFGMYSSDILECDEEEQEEEAEEEDELDEEGYAELLNDGSRNQFPGCTKFSKLHFLVRLLNMKNVWKVPRNCFDDMISLFRDTIPEGEKLPKNSYEAKKYIKKIGLGYDKIDACKNECVLFRGIHANATECPKCKESRWKSEKTGVDGTRVSRVAQKVARHFPLKKRIQRMFSSPEMASQMRWHDEGRTRDGMLRHPADSPHWNFFDMMHKDFRNEPRNVRFGLATDGFNPFKCMNLRYSIWPVLLIPYNVPPWMCLQQSNIILSVIVPGRKAPGKEMDIYVQLVIDELQVLWVHGILVHDAYFGKKFRVYAALLWTISDWQGRQVLSGESTAACSHCVLETSSRRLKHGRKSCFMAHRRFLAEDHEFRLDAASFDGTVEMSEVTQPGKG